MGVQFSREETAEQWENYSEAESMQSKFEVPRWSYEEDVDAQLDNIPNVVDISLLPVNILHKIAEKMNYQEFSRLDQTSKIGHAICNKGIYSVPHKVESVLVNKTTTKVIPCYDVGWYFYSQRRLVRWHVASQPPSRIKACNLEVYGPASSGRIQGVCKQFEKNHMQSEVVKVSDPIRFKPDDLDRLLKATSPVNFACSSYLAQEFFECSSIQSMPTLCLGRTGCSDNEFVNLKVTELLQMTNDFITAKGFNKFLKQWKNRERELGLIYICFESSKGTRNFEEILEGLEANPVWTPEWHQDSIVGSIPLDEFSPMFSGDPEHIFSIWRPEDHEKTVFIRLRNGSIEFVERPGDEVNDVIAHLTIDQYYNVLEKCYYCEKRFCVHRRRFSMGRLKKKLPLFYGAILAGIRVLSVVSGLNLLRECVTGNNSVIFLNLKGDQDSVFSP